MCTERHNHGVLEPWHASPQAMRFLMLVMSLLATFISCMPGLLLPCMMSSLPYNFSAMHVFASGCPSCTRFIALYKPHAPLALAGINHISVCPSPITCCRLIRIH